MNLTVIYLNNDLIAEDWGKVSEDAKNLIRKMLEVDPNKRLSAK